MPPSRTVNFFLSRRGSAAIRTHPHALAIREQVFGPQHPLTCMSRNNLRGLWRAAGHTIKPRQIVALRSELRMV